MKKFIAVLLILLISLVSIAFAEPKTNKKAAATTTKKKRLNQTQKYTAVQIDSNLEKLPSNYYGNDPKSIYDAIKKRNRSAVKGEFETTEQFQKRIDKENSLPIIGQIGPKGLFSLQARRTEVNYSADISELSVDIELQKVSEPMGYGIQKLINPSYKVSSYIENSKEISLTSEEKGSRSYAAQNRYGASTVVSESNYESYGAIVDNYRELPFIETVSKSAQSRYDAEEKKAIDSETKYGSTGKQMAKIYRDGNIIRDSDKEWRMGIKIKASPEEAKNIKDKVKILLIGNLDEPLIHEDFSYIEATMDSPSEHTFRSKYLYINLKEIWIYNQATGQIYSKIKRLAEK
ncbi:MAG: hypothetical protein JJE30_16005 [Desulfuromonadales bacterium]|nr:hypothetical protein [Desulfuromonadales bacterium]